MSFDAFGRFDETFDFGAAEIGALDKTQKIHDLGLIVEEIHNLWVC